jgi:NitT/TauT family transport system substrate-binding protein
MEVAQMAAQQATGFTEKMLWASLYGKYPEATGGAPVRMTLPFTINTEAMSLINSATTFLFSIKSINVEKLRPEAVMPDLAAAVLKERGLTSPVGKVTAMEDKAFTPRP